jgi:hypothetical protein
MPHSISRSKGALEGVCERFVFDARTLQPDSLLDALYMW